MAGSQGFSITGSGSRVEEMISGNYVSWNRGEVFADFATFDYDPGDYYGFYWDVTNYSIGELVDEYGYVPIRRTESWNSGGSGLWIEIWSGLPSAVLCLYPTGGSVALRPGPVGTAGIYYASGDGSHSIDETPIGDIELGIGDTGATTPANFLDSLLMVINQGDEWYYVWDRYQGGGG